jgi:hypothetical protein
VLQDTESKENVEGQWLLLINCNYHHVKMKLVISDLLAETGNVTPTRGHLALNVAPYS